MQGDGCYFQGNLEARFEENDVDRSSGFHTIKN